MEPERQDSVLPVAVSCAESCFLSGFRHEGHLAHLVDDRVRSLPSRGLCRLCQEEEHPIPRAKFARLRRPVIHAALFSLGFLHMFAHYGEAL